jgi:hypothetical protein
LRERAYIAFEMLRQELRPRIGRAAAGNIGRRGVGVGLFADGVIVQTNA